MKIAFIIYEGITALDFIGVYDPISRLKTMHFIDNLEIDICANTDTVSDFAKYIHIQPTEISTSLTAYDLIIIPGGFGSRKLMKSEEFLKWIKTSRGEAMKASVCTGALILGAAGFLKDKVATTHPNAYEELAPFCKTVKTERIVEDQNIITARGVTAGIDLGLYICGKLAGKAARERIAKQMDYQYREDHNE